MYKPGLTAAVNSFREWLSAQRAETVSEALLVEKRSPLPLSPHEVLLSSRQGGPESDVLAETAQPPPPLDLVALAPLRKAIKPKFALGSSSASTNLFDEILENDAEEERVATAYLTPVLVPGRCRFIITDVSNFRALSPGEGQRGFDCIVMDPPWENRSAKRAGRYLTLPSRNLLSISIPSLLNKEGGLVVLWVTNRERLRQFVERELLPAWQLQLIATWHWLKICDSGELVGSLEVAHRRPYETLLIAASNGWRSEGMPVPEHYHIFATPGEHSRKPHLGRLLRRHLPANPTCLELFARELAAGWTSAGNEPLYFQRLDLFEPATVSLATPHPGV